MSTVQCVVFCTVHTVYTVLGEHAKQHNSRPLHSWHSPRRFLYTPTGGGPSKELRTLDNSEFESIVSVWEAVGARVGYGPSLRRLLLVA